MRVKKKIRRWAALLMLLALLSGLAVPAWAVGGEVQAPELAMWTPTSAEVRGVEGQEYVIAPKGEEPDWNQSTEPVDGFVSFDNLTPAAAYTIFTRLKAVDGAEASEPLTTDLTVPLIGVGVFSEDDYVVGATLTVEPDPVETEGLTYQWYYDEITSLEEGREWHDFVPIDGATATTYTIQAADAGQYLAVKVFRDQEEVGDIDSLGPVLGDAAPTDDTTPADDTAPQDDACPQDGTCPISRFSDASPTDWYHDGVHWALEHGIMNGVSEDTFQPNGTATRAMVVTMLWRLEGQPEGAASSFTDVKAESWYEQAVNWAADTGVVNGTSDTAFSPDEPITREQLAAILYRYAQTKGRGFTGDWVFPLSYPDADQVAEYAYEPLCWMTMHGIIKGLDDGSLAPKDNATRAQIATMFQRFCAGLAPVDATVDYGTSALYTQEEMDAAISLIRAELDGWSGCELHSIRYAGDDCNSEKNVQWLNELKEGMNYTQCIEFLTDFHSPEENSGPLEPDWEYTDYQWWLARAEGSGWELLSWGY